MIMIETNRLLLREMGPEDFDALYAVLADSDIMQHYPYTFDEARVQNWINKNIERYRVFGFGLWAVCLNATGEMIGDCGLTMQRIGGQAVRDWTFAHTPFGMVYSYMKQSNLPSAAVARANGMTLLREYTDAEQEQTAIYGISRADWETRNMKHGT